MSLTGWMAHILEAVCDRLQAADRLNKDQRAAGALGLSF